MTCTRRYTPAAIADLQRIAEAVEAERRRQHWAEFAQELRHRINMFDYRYGGTEDYAAGHDDGWDAALGEVEKAINELSPAISCDNPIE